METIKVKPCGGNQGEHVVINAEDFDAAMHEKLAEEVAEEVAEKVVGKPGRKPRMQMDAE